MSPRRVVVATLLSAMAAMVAIPAMAAPRWREVHSPHFLVVTDGSANDGRRVAGQLERVREVFQLAFPGLQVDPAMPIEVLALAHRSDLKAIEPADYLGKGKVQLGGYFQRGEERNYIMIALDTGGELHPYAAIYHEYTHMLAAKDADTMPLWAEEGLAEFYQNTAIEGNRAIVGQPDAENLDLLRSQSLLPLTTLFQVNYTSPYYHEEDQANIFYAESWALTDYLMTLQARQKVQLLRPYLALVGQGVDAVTAGQRAFGDLDKLQQNLEQYVRQLAFSDFEMKLPPDGVQEKTYPADDLPLAAADAVRADFMAHVARFTDATALLQSVLQRDPDNVAARETLGFIAMQQGQFPAALQWYTQAVGLNSQDFLAQYYFAAMTQQNAGADAAAAGRVEASLRTAIKLNAAFAPAYDRLAVAEAQHGGDLADARRQELEAVQLDPSQFAYRLNLALVLINMRSADSLNAAAQVLHNAQPLASTPAEVQECRDALTNVEMMQQQAQPPAPQGH